MTRWARVVRTTNIVTMTAYNEPLDYQEDDGVSDTFYVVTENNNVTANYIYDPATGTFSAPIIVYSKEYMSASIADHASDLKRSGININGELNRIDISTLQCYINKWEDGTEYNGFLVYRYSQEPIIIKDKEHAQEMLDLMEQFTSDVDCAAYLVYQDIKPDWQRDDWENHSAWPTSPSYSEEGDDDDDDEDEDEGG